MLIAGIDLRGKVALVTGRYSGIGIETVRALASAGARVFVGARRPKVAAGDLADVAGDGNYGDGCNSPKFGSNN